MGLKDIQIVLRVTDKKKKKELQTLPEFISKEIYLIIFFFLPFQLRETPCIGGCKEIIMKKSF